MLTIAAVLIILLGIAHSFLGEKYILIRLFKRDGVPELFGNGIFTKGTLRFAWHLTTVAWFGIAAVMLIEDRPSTVFLNTVAIVSAVSGVLSAWFTKGKHLSWLVFFTISVLTFLGAPYGYFV